MDAEQWVKGGDCSKCRKVNYCSKFCKEHERKIDRNIRDAFDNTEAGKMLNEINKMLERW